MSKELNIGFVGNPNCGKTTLFNAYTGAKLKVANWPGVTVEKKEGVFKFHDSKFKLVDLPGIYSLTSYTIEEKLSREYIMSEDIDVIINVVDASSLERNLFLTLQLLELGKPVVIALNMMDIVEERGMEIDLHRLPEMLGVPVIPVSARKKTGLEILMHAVAHHKQKVKDNNLEHHHNEEGILSKHMHNHHNDFAIVYTDEIEDMIDSISSKLINKYGDINNVRWHTIKLLEHDPVIMKRYPLELRETNTNYEKIITCQKYDFIEEIIEETLINKSNKELSTDKIDKILTHKYFGIPIFFTIMIFVFFLTFTVGDMVKGGLEILLERLSITVTEVFSVMSVGSVITSLVVDGIIAGVGGILTFLPNIFILFLALAVLEDSGYMSRVAYIMDGLMGKIGLSGKAFIPMLLGFGCTVPAVMASRTLEDERDRIKTMLVTPFMSCSAKLPIYVLFAGMFFPKSEIWVAFSMYLIGIIVAIIIALILNLLQREKEINTLLIELPEYKSPNFRTIMIYVFEKIKHYISKAGTTIFVASVLIWFILNFGIQGKVDDMSLSFGAVLGKSIVPIFKPAGLGFWQVVVSLISGLAAKEVVVSSFLVLFSAGSVGTDSIALMLSEVGFGSLNAFALMVFCLLYVPCVATVATIKKETNSWKWTGVSVSLQLVVAWIVTTIIYTVGKVFFL